MSKRLKVVIVGGTSAIAEHCARLWVQKHPVDLTLIARDAGRAERIASDLKIRGSESCFRVVQANFLDPSAIQSTVDEVMTSEAVDIVLIAHGSLSDQVACQDDVRTCRDSLEINGISPVLYAEAFSKYMAEVDHGTLAIIGSVAGDRGRKTNYVYGAAKGLLDRYAQGMQHRFAGTGVKIVLIKPGPTATPMTNHLVASGARLAPVEKVASGIVAAIERGVSIAYVPGKWRLIMLVIRHLPARIFNRLNI